MNSPVGKLNSPDMTSGVYHGHHTSPKKKSVFKLCLLMLNIFHFQSFKEVGLHVLPTLITVHGYNI